MLIKIIDRTFNEQSGYFKLVLDNDDKILLTKKEYQNLEVKDFHKYQMFESSNGNFYKPYGLNGVTYFNKI